MDLTALEQPFVGGKGDIAAAQIDLNPSQKKANSVPSFRKISVGEGLCRCRRRSQEITFCRRSIAAYLGRCGCGGGGGGVG